jgi:hypothetical protein
MNKRASMNKCKGCQDTRCRQGRQDSAPDGACQTSNMGTQNSMLDPRGTCRQTADLGMSWIVAHAVDVADTYLSSSLGLCFHIVK